jgi:hypothetical protein
MVWRSVADALRTDAGNRHAVKDRILIMDPHSNKTASIPLHRVAVLRPFVQVLAEAGAPVERFVQQSGIPYRAIDDLNNYVPSGSALILKSASPNVLN